MSVWYLFQHCSLLCVCVLPVLAYAIQPWYSCYLGLQEALGGKNGVILTVRCYVWLDGQWVLRNPFLHRQQAGQELAQEFV